MKMSPEEIERISHGTPSEIAAVITRLLEIIDQQAARIVALENRVAELERQLGQNSQNSSKPPSSDGFRKPSNSRKSGGKKGAPKGHTGHTLHLSEHPDTIILHPVTTCSHCAASLVGEPSEGYEKRQVFDLPQPRFLITEYRAEKKCCPHCRSMQQAAFPDQVNAPVQYGDSLTTWTVYLMAYQMLPLSRTCEIFTDLTGHRPSEATLLSRLDRAHTQLAPYEQTIRKRVLSSQVAHADETTLRVDKSKVWLHNLSTPNWTFQGVHEHRGSKAFDDLGLLPRYTGILVHDCNMPYFKEKYSFQHALCGAHLLRECQGIAEYDHHHWASQMKGLLQQSWRLVRSARQANRPLAPNTLTYIDSRYEAILRLGKSESQRGRKREKTGPCGRKSKSKAANLGERFRLHKEAILRFLRDDRVPFDNNQAERDLRMAKVKHKISGTFRTRQGADQFARARSFISTLRKQQLPILASLSAAIRHDFQFLADLSSNSFGHYGAAKPGQSGLSRARDVC
ncbi:IS66 family transposase [Paenibacillus hodogayensis]|uniref:IS66 family transposase n=1 Tax=Paenibacillus hodogayensis TaxID=279208 RepID=A0ABV5W7X7_9BACL